MNILRERWTLPCRGNDCWEGSRRSWPGEGTTNEEGVGTDKRVQAEYEPAWGRNSQTVWHQTPGTSNIRHKYARKLNGGGRETGMEVFERGRTQTRKGLRTGEIRGVQTLSYDRRPGEDVPTRPLGLDRTTYDVRMASSGNSTVQTGLHGYGPAPLRGGTNECSTALSPLKRNTAQTCMVDGGSSNALAVAWPPPFLGPCGPFPGGGSPEST